MVHQKQIQINSNSHLGEQFAVIGPESMYTSLRRSPILRALCSVFILTLAGCSKMDEDRSNYISNKDRAFMNQVSAVNQAIINVGALAPDKASSAAVNDLATQLLVKFIPSQDSLRALIYDLGQSTIPDTAMRYPARETELKSYAGATFDTAWLSTQVTYGNRAVQLLESEINDGHNPRFKDYAVAHLPVVKELTVLADSVKRAY